MNRCWEAIAIAFIMGMLVLGGLLWLRSRERVKARNALGWQHFTKPFMNVKIKPAELSEIRWAISDLREEQGFSEEWESRFVSVLRSRMRADGYMTLEVAVLLLRRELEGY